MSPADSWGWAGTVRQFLSTPVDVWRQSLADHHVHLLMQRHSSFQDMAWTDSYWAMHQALGAAVMVDGDALAWSVVFEYELPLEGGRRPDVVVLAGSTVIVIECKSTGSVLIADVDQVGAYARDLADYHKATHSRQVVSILLLVGSKGQASIHEGVVATSPDGLAKYLVENASAIDENAIDLDEWLRSPYEPLPTLVAAAKRIFAHEPLPHVYTALAAGIPETVERLVAICDDTEEDGRRTLAFVTGVPGSGKTLVGLRLVYERSTLEGKAAFLSGNGPLVDVLQDALRSSVFVKDLHRIVLSYGKQRKLPRENILVFDEAQRAWDRSQVQRKHGIESPNRSCSSASGKQFLTGPFSSDWWVRAKRSTPARRLASSNGARRSGLLASSHAKLLPKHGVPNDFMTTNKMMRFGRWYNAPRSDPRSCCGLITPVTEFGCQGLELDLPIVCWGEDMRWTGGEWLLTPIRRQVTQENPRQLLLNTYRVLLTRGRDGFVVYIPEDQILDRTEVALLAAGIKPLPDPVELSEAPPTSAPFSASGDL